MPVYKESLEEVIQLSYFNVQRAMDFYTAKGGRVKFIVCDDGLQVSRAPRWCQVTMGCWGATLLWLNQAAVHS
jgi:hypothetical protein